MMMASARNGKGGFISDETLMAMERHISPGYQLQWFLCSFMSYSKKIVSGNLLPLLGVF